MARRAEVIGVFSRGVLDPLLRERIDLEHYQRGLLYGDNLSILPQGGAFVRGGFRHKARLRRQLRRFPLTAAMVTAPNGGTVANVVDCQDSTETATTSGVTGATFVVFSVDLGVATAFTFVDVTGFRCAANSADAAFAVEVSSDGTNWFAFDRAFNIRTTARTRRFSAGAGQSVTRRYLRVVVKDAGSLSLGVITIKEIAVWQETTKLSAVRRYPFTFSRDQTYTMIATDRNIDVFAGGEWQTSIPISMRSDQLQVTTRVQSRDLMMLLHPEVPPRTIFRQGADFEWTSYDQTFSNVATGGGDTSFGAAQDEIQRVTISGVGPLDGIALVVGDCWTAQITIGSDAATLAGAIDTALEALPNVAAGIEIEVTSLTIDAVTFEVTFGGDNGSRVQPKLFVDVITDDDATVDVTTLQDGRAASGSLMSSATGWPRCGTFFADRLVLAGFLLAPDTLLMSVSSSYFDFDQSTGLENAAGLEITLGSDDQVVIHHVFAGRHLQVFTDSGEWYVSDRVLDATLPISFINTTRNGCLPGVPQVQVEGASIFADAGGRVVRDFLYQDAEQDYTAESLTLLGGHLIEDVRDIAYQRSSQVNEGAKVLIVNGDGTIAAMTFMRTEKVRAMSPWSRASGLFRAVNVDAQRAVDAVVERTIGKVTDLYFERQDDASLFDSSVAFSRTMASTTVSGLDHLEGFEVWAQADGRIEGPFTVASGQITLSEAALTGEVGLRIVPRVHPMPQQVIDRSGRVRLGPVRIFGATLSLRDTSSIAFGANGGPVQDVPLLEFDAATFDGSLIDAPFTGEVRLDRLFGRSQNGGLCEVTQLRPGTFTLRSLKLEIG
jgi:hypothetical protein